MTDIWAIGGTAFSTLFCAFVIAIMRKALQKWHIDVDDAKAEKLAAAAVGAIHYVEEIGSKQPMTPAQKLALAIEYVIQQHPTASRTDADMAIHTMLPQVGVGAASKEADVAPPLASNVPPASK